MKVSETNAAVYDVGPAPRSTRQRMQRDKEVHRLGLTSVERLHPDVLIDIVQVSKATYVNPKGCAWKALVRESCLI